MAGSQSELTAGELLGMTSPRAAVEGQKLSRVPNCSPKPESRMERLRPRDRPFRTVPMWVRA